MKQIWEKPTLLKVGIENTNEGISSCDLGHGYDDVPHIHQCNTCRIIFNTWDEAVKHVRDMENNQENHWIGFIIPKS